MANKVIVICGPTASGKTSLAVELAKKINGEIISADALLVYKGLDIGTAKPTIEERQGVVHHLIDVVSPKCNFSVSDYERLALPIVQDLLAKSKTPIICGGTGFYIQSLLYKSQFGGTGADEKVRAYYEEILATHGKAYLHDLLQQVDEESAQKLHENDTKRVIRALEIYHVTGKKKSLQADEPVPRFDFAAFSVDYPREVLYSRIGQRVEQMFEQGLEAETEALLQNGVEKCAQCMQAIGYKEIVEGRELGLDREEIKELIKKNTRNYAKRQITFFKRMQNHMYIDGALPLEEKLQKILKTLAL